MNDCALHKELITALEWYVDNGVTDILMEEAIDRTQSIDPPPVMIEQGYQQNDAGMPATLPQELAAQMPPAGVGAPAFLGKADAREEAIKLAKAASTLDELRETIAEFDGIALKKTATNMVFSDGNLKADIMLIGDAPGADEDRVGKPFVGSEGHLLDRILHSIDIDRSEDDPKKSVYISNILNWRPPGNRTPSPAEIEVSLPFIERHIALVQPKILILCGGGAAKSLLGSSLSISRLRKSWHAYKPQTEGLGLSGEIPAIATYHPSVLLKTPVQKKAVWADMLMLQEKRLIV
ncbi:MAG: uracil-DNA glycosylase [Alphaproteobacteria bacterium]